MAYPGLLHNHPRTTAIDLGLEVATAQPGFDLIDLGDSESVVTLLPSQSSLELVAVSHPTEGGALVG